MTDLKNRLDIIFINNVSEYKRLFDRKRGINAMTNNLNSFSIVLDKLSDELINESNAILKESDILSKDELSEYIKILILKFRDLKLSPFG